MTTLMECLSVDAENMAWLSEPGCMIPYAQVPINCAPIRPGDILQVSFTMSFGDFSEEVLPNLLTPLFF